MKLIPLTRGYEAIVDDLDYDQLVCYRWIARPDKHTVYAFRMTRLNNGRSQPVLMHRQILGLEVYDPRKVDHKDGNGLNNSRSNLRTCNRSQNQQNMRVSRGRSRFKGVTKHTRSCNWQASITHDGRKYHLGTFESEESAAAAYNTAAVNLFGEFACLNEIPLTSTPIVSVTLASNRPGAHKRVCKNGHLLTENNVYIPPKGDRRACKTCRKESKNKRRSYTS